MKKRKKIIILCVVLLAITFTVFGIKRWVTVKLPEQFSISRVYITLHPDSIFLKIRVVMPDNDIADRLFDSMRYSVSFDTTEFASGIKIFGKESADTIIDLPLGMNREKLSSTIKKLQANDSTYLNIRLEPYINMPGSKNKKIPFTIDKKMKVPIPPEITLHDIDLEKLRLKEIELNATLKVINLNGFEFIIHGGSLNLDFVELFDGVVSITEPVHLKSRDTTVIETAIQLGEMKMARTAWNYAFKKEDMEYSLYGKLYISTVDEPHDTIDVIIRSNKTKLKQAI